MTPIDDATIIIISLLSKSVFVPKPMVTSVDCVWEYVDFTSCPVTVGDCVGTLSALFMNYDDIFI